MVRGSSRSRHTDSRHTEGRPMTDLDESELSPRIGKVARRELALHGYTTYHQLTTASPQDLLRIHGVGPKAVRILAEELQTRGLGLAAP
jgi:predicted flap endonuclease-1-like 5' DNA nuclease